MGTIGGCTSAGTTVKREKADIKMKSHYTVDRNIASELSWPS